jgi:hypothetical protein
LEFPAEGKKQDRLGVAAQFDAISLWALKPITTYSTDDIDVDTATEGQTFAIRTNLGNYAKARIFRVINRSDGIRWFQDLVLQIVVYR